MSRLSLKVQPFKTFDPARDENSNIFLEKFSVGGTLEAEFQNGVSSIPVGGNTPSIGWWITWPPVTQLKERSLIKY